MTNDLDGGHSLISPSQELPTRKQMKIQDFNRIASSSAMNFKTISTLSNTSDIKPVKNSLFPSIETSGVRLESLVASRNNLLLDEGEERMG